MTKLGHEPSYHVLDGKNQSLLALAKCGADLVFNLTESYAGDDTMDKNIAAYLELLHIPYTGGGPQALYLAQDKSIAKKIFDFHKIKTPDFATSYKGRTDHSHDIEFPLIVKPVSEDGSIGIDNGSVVDSVKELMERIHYIHEEFDSPALIEEYIEGREIYAAILGNDNAEVLPLIELDLSKLPKGTPRIAGQDVKFDQETEAYKVTKSAPAEDLDEETTKKLQDTALAAYRALKLRDYGRIDMRLEQERRGVRHRSEPEPMARQRRRIHHGRQEGRLLVHRHDREDRGTGPRPLDVAERGSRRTKHAMVTAMPNHSIQLPFNRREPDTSAFMHYPQNLRSIQASGEPGLRIVLSNIGTFGDINPLIADCAGAEAARPHAGDGAARCLPAEDRAAGPGVSRAAARHRPHQHHARGDDLRREKGHGDGAARVSVSRAARRPTTICWTRRPSPRAPTCCCWAS